VRQTELLTFQFVFVFIVSRRKHADSEHN